jgi:hypothetical protein
MNRNITCISVRHTTVPLNELLKPRKSEVVKGIVQYDSIHETILVINAIAEKIDSNGHGIYQAVH